jgi:hypothetical protein
MQKQLVWTVLPAGQRTTASGTVLRLSIFISPRLTPAGPSGTLAEFDWAGGANFASWMAATTVRFAFGATVLDASRIDAATGGIDPSLWPVVFPPQTPVRGHAHESLSGAQNRWFSYPAVALAQTIVGWYEQIARQHFDEVRASSVPEASRALAAPFADAAVALERLNRVPTDDEVTGALGITGLPPSMRATAIAFFRLYRFYHRRPLAGPESPPRAPVTAPSLDFHQIVTMLGDHPALLRRLGLVTDYDVFLPASVTLPGSGGVRAVVSGAFADDRFPVTAYRRTSSVFTSASLEGSDLVDGMLDLRGSGPHARMEVDVDGAALKVMQFQRATGRRAVVAAGVPADDPDERWPALRGDGVAVARSQRGAQLQALAGRQTTIDGAIRNGALAAEGQWLRADDITRGFRVDVLDRGAWRSLCRRRGSYRVGDSGSPTTIAIDDEGFVKAASATGEEDRPEDVYLHEHVFSWDGFSLVAPRPGRTLTVRDDEDRIERANDVANTAYRVETDVRPAEGTLPRLRYGATYRMRARVVDLAGNSLGLDTAGAAYATPEFRYLRSEPVPSPTLVHRFPITEGEWLEHLVIRSDRGVSASAYVRHPSVAASGYRERCERHVAPPKATLRTVELHGALDPFIASENPATRRTSYLVALKEGGTLLDREVLDTQTGQMTAVDVELHDTPETPAESRGVWPKRRGDSLAPGQYVAHPSEQLKLPYLPDPASRGIAFYHKPSGQRWTRPWSGSYPHPQPFRMVLEEGPERDGPRIVPAGATLRVILPKATIFKVRYSSLVPREELERFRFFASVQTSSLALIAATESRHWMLTPHREVTFVHAVQRPLEDPKTAAVTDTSRAERQTYATVRGTIALHGRSTGQLDLFAHWDEPEDFVSRPAPSTERKQALVGTFHPAYEATSYPLDNLPLAGNTKALRHEFGDTKHHEVVYQAVATTRYREYFPASLWANPENIQVKEPVMEAQSGALTGTVVHVLATERPRAPEVHSVLPTFLWSESQQGRIVHRDGGSVRIYLERPWYSSGAGELLGIVVESPDHPLVPNADGVTIASDWASDPIRQNRTPRNKLEAGHFTGAARVGRGITVPGQGTTRVDVVGYKPQFDEERKLWYCDVHCRPGTGYYPFLRLIVCRYQPHALPGLELSTLVDADFIQIPPKRSASVTRSGNRVELRVWGPTGDAQGALDVPVPGGGPGLWQGDAIPAPGSASPARGAHHWVRAYLERRDPSSSSDLDWFQQGVAITLPPHVKGDSGGEAVWATEADLPSEARTFPSRYRWVVEEHELFPADAEVAAPGSPTPPSAQRQPGYDKPSSVPHRLDPEPSSRIVYIAHLPVPASGPSIGT